MAFCADCFECVTEPGQACAAASDACDAIQGCMFVSQCMAACTAGGLCIDNCCDGHTNAAIDAAIALDDCQRETCLADPCSDYNEAPCQQ